VTCTPIRGQAAPCHECGKYDPKSVLHVVEGPEGIRLFCERCCVVCRAESKRT
jgi:hypothetical protein